MELRDVPLSGGAAFTVFPLRRVGNICMSVLWSWWWSRRLGVAGWLAVAVFAILTGRFWHPHYGFTKFLQIDETDKAAAVHEMRDWPVYYYPGQNGYDATAYVQIAFHPLLDSPELKPAIGNVPYRARRILGSALAWLFSGGQPSHIANVYASLNLGFWLVLAGLLWRLLAVQDGRGWIAWAGLLFSAGALHTVRLALTDLPGLTLFAGAMVMAERGRSRGALGVLALAGLARETTLSGVVALWRGPWTSPRAWLANLGRMGIVVLPLAAWIGYMRWKVGPAQQGVDNFTWPVVGLLEKWWLTIDGYRREPQFAWLTTTTLLAMTGLTVQAIFFLRRPKLDDAWWRVGITGVVMMLLLGTSVWEGHPGAALRVLLPMGLAFAVYAVRQKASLAWLVAGNLSVLSGVLAFWEVPQDANELAAGRLNRGSYLVRLGPGWYGAEQSRNHVWSWSSGQGRVTVESSPPTDATLQVRMGVRALATRTIEIRQNAIVLWRGTVGEKRQEIEFAGVRAGSTTLDLSTDAPPVREGAGSDARALGFAVYDLRIE
jgi:hypothetical protein